MSVAHIEALLYKTWIRMHIISSVCSERGCARDFKPASLCVPIFILSFFEDYSLAMHMWLQMGFSVTLARSGDEFSHSKCYANAEEEKFLCRDFNSGPERLDFIHFIMFLEVSTLLRLS